MLKQKLIAHVVCCRTKSPGRHGVVRVRVHVFPARQSALAGSEGGDQAAEVRTNQREEDVNANRGAVQRIPL